MSTANIIGNAIFGLRNKSGGNYLDPAVKESLVGLWKFDQNTNESPTRNIIKNTIKDKGGDLELLNFGYKLNSGYNGYATDFTEWNAGNTNKTQTKVTVNRDIDYPISIISFENATSAPSFRIKVSRLPKGQNLYYRYINEEGLLEGRFDIPSDGIYTLPATAVSDTPTKVAMLANERYGINIKGLTIEQLPLYEGALVTDGKDDMIVSQKTVQEMLGGSNVCTVVSMIHQINLSIVSSITSINNIRSESVAHVCARHLNTAYGKTGIFGYSKQLNTTSNPTLINNILGDKKDCIAEGGSVIDTTDKYFVQGYKYNDSLYELSEVAIYWTFISNKVLTTDEINQIIAYFKLDKYVTPQVIYDVKRQGLTNDTPAADWYLKDFSGNGYDMQLYNYAKSKDSGIGKYAEDFTTWNKYNNVVVTKDKITVTDKFNQDWLVYKYSKSGSGISPMRIKITGIPINARIEYRYAKTSSDTALSSFDILEDGVYDIPESFIINNEYSVGFKLSVGDWTHIEITQIPDYEGALVSDGKDDYGKAEGLPILKDYTVAADYARLAKNISSIGDSPILSKSMAAGNGAFIMNSIDNSGITACYSFGTGNSITLEDIQRKIYYQSKYSNQGKGINVGSAEDGTSMWLDTIRDNDTRFIESAFYSMLLFPYSLSEFLLERQLKKYKLGTLYPDMVEFRPVVKSSSEYQVVDFYIDNLPAVVGKYYPINSALRIAITTQGQVDEISSIKVNGVDFGVPSINGNRFTFNGTLSDKSPQKIDITIDEYIRFEDIVQPYPYVVVLSKDNRDYTWGDKIKVGDTITCRDWYNLYPTLYAADRILYNGNTIHKGEEFVITKESVFSNVGWWGMKNNVPHAIYSPQKLNIPNSSLKILGYVPDLTGKGNHGKLNNFAYAGMSGANGYVEDFTKWARSSSLDDVEITYDKIKVNKLTGSTVLYVTSNKFINKIKIVASGIPNGGKLTFTQYPDNAIENNKEFEIGGVTTTGSWGFSIKEGLNLDWSNLVIQQIGEHEGSICFDGTDDHITIPTLAHGGKCVMMKVNWSNENTILYDQRLGASSTTNPFAIYIDRNDVAYQARNISGLTYIDGILNKNIIGHDLANVTHNIIITNEEAKNDNSISPLIGKSNSNSFYSDMSLYEFILFPEIPSEDEIKKLNDVMGIEENVFLIHLKNDDTEIINETLILNE